MNSHVTRLTELIPKVFVERLPLDAKKWLYFLIHCVIRITVASLTYYVSYVKLDKELQTGFKSYPNNYSHLN